MRPKKDFSKEPAWLRISDDLSDRTNAEHKSENNTDLTSDGIVSEHPGIAEELESKPKKPLSGKEKKRLRKVNLIVLIRCQFQFIQKA